MLRPLIIMKMQIKTTWDITPIRLLNILKSNKTRVGRIWNKQNCQLNCELGKALWKLVLFGRAEAHTPCDSAPLLGPYLAELHVRSRNIHSSTLSQQNTRDNPNVRQQEKGQINPLAVEHIHPRKSSTTMGNMGYSPAHVLSQQFKTPKKTMWLY